MPNYEGRPKIGTTRTMERTMTEDQAHEIYNAHVLKGEAWRVHYGDCVDRFRVGFMEDLNLNHEEAFIKAVQTAERLLPVIQQQTGEASK